MTTVTYSYRRSYSGNRPYGDVTLLGIPGYTNVFFKALVDTGADYLQLPQSAASTAGLNMSSAVTRSVSGSTGRTTMLFLSGVSVEVEGKKITADVLFDSSGSSNALLGRQALLTAVEAGFNDREWLWEF